MIVGSTDDRLAIIVKTGICDKIIAEYSNVMTINEGRQGLRAGHAGHLLELSNFIVAACEKDANFANAVNSSVCL